MKIVVTGALGHIGSQLIRDLPSHFPGAVVVMVDNMSTQRYVSLFDLPEVGKYEFHETDIFSADLTSLISDAAAVVHLAAITDAANSFKNKDLVHHVNVDGTRLVAEACIAADCPLIFPSTTSVYGTQASIVDENCTMDELRPQSPYADSKLAAERMLEELAVERNLRFMTCRLGTIFGISPGMRFHTAINKFCWQAVMRQPITVWRTALNQNRPYLSLTDAVSAIAFIIRNAIYDGRVYNVVSTNSSVGDIVSIIDQVIGNVAIEYVDTEIMNQLSYHVDSSRFRDTGFAFDGELRDGIEETIALLKNSQSAQRPALHIAR